MNAAMVDRFEVAAGVAASVLSYAVRRGIDAAPIASACGLDRSKFSQMFERISLDRLCRFMEALALLAGDEEFGLKAGAAFDKGASGPFGYALMHAPTARAAVEFLGRNFFKVADLSHCLVREDSTECRLEWSYSPLILRRDQFADMGAAATISHLKGILGPHTDRVGVELERGKPKNIQIYKDLLTRIVTFDAPVHALVFPVALLSHRNPRADPRLFEILSTQVDNMRADRPDADDPITAVRYIVLDSIGKQMPSLAGAAARIGMSERTLQRRLTGAGTSLQTIIDESRREAAEKMLTETSLSLAQIGYRLGFSAPSAFTRSATRWFGTSPSQFRRKFKG